MKHIGSLQLRVSFCFAVLLPIVCFCVETFKATPRTQSYVILPTAHSFKFLYCLSNVMNSLCPPPTHTHFTHMLSSPSCSGFCWQNVLYPPICLQDLTVNILQFQFPHHSTVFLPLSSKIDLI